MLMKHSGGLGATAFPVEHTSRLVVKPLYEGQYVKTHCETVSINFITGLHVKARCETPYRTVVKLHAHRAALKLD